MRAHDQAFLIPTLTSESQDSWMIYGLQPLYQKIEVPSLGIMISFLVRPYVSYSPRMRLTAHTDIIAASKKGNIRPKTVGTLVDLWNEVHAMLALDA